MASDFRQSVMEASRRPEVAAAVRGVYRKVQEAIEQRRPVCEISGRCCRFEEFGHRLYVTTIEVAAFLQALGEGRDGSAGALLAAWDARGCPFQVNRLCRVHLIRPFGCRIFFCDATAEQWQQEQYERFHARLKSLHESLGVPYFYVEWREAVMKVLRPGSDEC